MVPTEIGFVVAEMCFGVYLVAVMSYAVYRNSRSRYIVFHDYEKHVFALSYILLKVCEKGSEETLVTGYKSAV